MSDIKKYAVTANVAAAAAAIPCVLFFLAEVTGLVPVVFAALLTAACCAALTVYARERQSARTVRSARAHAAVCAVIMFLADGAVRFFAEALTDRLPEKVRSFFPALAASCFTFVFIAVLLFRWRSAYKKTMNRKPFPFGCLPVFLMIAALAAVSVKYPGHPVPQNDFPALPSPVGEDFLPVQPEYSPEALHFYVSPSAGSAENDALSPETPAKDIAAVKELIRTVREMQTDVVVHLAAGEYGEDDFIFTAADSGTEECEIVYLAGNELLSVSGNLNVSVARNAEHITFSGFSFCQNDTVEVSGNHITVSGCDFAGCPLNVSGGNNRIEYNHFTMTNGASVTDRGIADKITSNCFNNVNAITDGVLALYGTDSDAENNCFSDIGLRHGTACVFIADEACGVTLNGNMLLNVPGTAVSYRENGRGDVFRSFFGNYLLNSAHPVVEDRSGGAVTVKCSGNVIVTSGNAEDYPLNAVYTMADVEKIFTAPYSGDYSFAAISPVKAAFPSLEAYEFLPHDGLLTPGREEVTDVSETVSETAAEAIVLPSSLPETEAVSPTEEESVFG